MQSKTNNTGPFVSGALALGVLLAGLGLPRTAPAATNVFTFTQPDRAALLADGWDFLATTTNGVPRNTETTNGATISYDQTEHSGVLRIPVDAGDLWANANNTRNSLFRTLSSNWVSLRLWLTFAPTQDFQQVHLAVYQDDDNYVEAGLGHSGGTNVALVREVGGAPAAISQFPISATNLVLRLDRELAMGDIAMLYSEDGTNWLSLGGVSQALSAPRLSIWAGGSAGGLPNLDLSRLEIVTSDQPLTTSLIVQPQSLVFNAVAGQPCAAVQRVRAKHRGPDPLAWTLTASDGWLAASRTNGPATGMVSPSFDVSVDTTGLAPGTYQGALNFSAPGADNSPAVNVTLIVNPAARAGTAAWRGGKSGALSLWVDDSNPGGFDELRTNGLAGTYVFWNLAPIPAFATNYFNAGMELGSHTFHHPCFLVNETSLRSEIESNLAAILAATPQTPAGLISFAWPCGVTSTNEEIVAADYFLAARGYNINRLEDPTPNDFMNLRSFNSHEHDPGPAAPPNPANLTTVVDAAITQGKWANLVLHGFSNDDGAMAYAVGKDVWIATGGAVTKYIVQRDRTIITNYTEAPGAIRFEFYRLPVEPTPVREFENAIVATDKLTLQVDVTGVPSVTGVSVDDAPAGFEVRPVNGRTMLYFDALVGAQAQAVLVAVATNHPPALPAQGDQTIGHLTMLIVSNAAEDADSPANQFAYTLVAAPAGAQIDAGGVITWTPESGPLPRTNTITTMVTDNGVPPLSATNSFAVQVWPQPVIQSVIPTEEGLLLTWSTFAGWSYRVQYKDSLTDTNWTDLVPDLPAVGGATASFIDPDTSSGARFYRILAIP